ncbi:protein TASOR [Salminus brasiliensis]|uniref:protein TASOR n=1 Tax=Salminus brasiliensis TaxID=930266 RepID=UPI003B82C8EB
MECRPGRAAERQQRLANTAELHSNQDGERSDGDEELAAEFEDGSETRKSRGGSDAKPGGPSLLSSRLVDEPPRLNFQIPRRNKEKRALIQYLTSASREFGEILKIITSSCKDPSSAGNFVYTKPRLVHSELLEKEFIEKRKELKQDGRTDKELAESFCFLLCEAHKVPLVCEKGLSVGSSWINILGNPTKGVYLSQFSDLLQAGPHEPGCTGEMIIFKVIKGKVKSIHDSMSRTLDPTPKFDSHFSKNANRVTSLQSFRAFEYTQQYFYEYVDYELASRPRHACPYAVVSFQFKGKEAITVGPKPMPLQRSDSMPSGTSGEKCGYIVWKGQFVNGGKDVYHTSLRSLSQPFLPFKLPDRVEIGKVMKLDQVKGIISSSFFSWDLYSGSHEVFKRGLHCSLFEVVEKSKSAENLTLLFQKLEEQGLVFVNSVSDNGFLFLLSSNQMSNSNERQAGWKKSCGQALFIYRHARDVSKFSSKPPADSTSLLPVPQDPIMPHLDNFIPAFHYALSKVRCNPPSNLGAGVEQQAHDYLSSIREGKLVHRVRLDYDHKLDEREKLFPAPRQKYNWENYVRSYFYSPQLFTMPVEKAKNMMEMLRCVPESSTDLETMGGAEAHRDPERLKQLLKLIQISKDQKAKQKESMLEEAASDGHGLKRKFEDEANEISPKKTALLNNGEPGEGRAEELQPCQSLDDVLSSVGLHDTDLRKDKTKGALKVVKLLDKLNETTHDTDLRKDKGQGALVMKILENLGKTLSGSSLANTGGTDLVESTEDTEAALHDSMTKLGLPTNCDIDLRKRLADDGEAQGKNDLEEETAGSLSSLEAFSPCSDTNGQQRGVNLLGERSIPWVLIPITGLKTERYSHRRDNNLDDPRYLQSPTVSTHTSPEKKDLPCPDQPDSSNVLTESEMEVDEDQDTNLTDELKVSHSQEQRGTPHNAVDCIVDEQISGFSTEVEDLLREERVYYIPYSSSHTHRNPPRTHVAPFSEYVSHFYTPLPVHTYINSFRDSISAFIDPQLNKWDSTTHAVSVLPSPAHSSVSSSAPEALPSDLLISSPHINAPLHSPSTVPVARLALASNLTPSSTSSTHTLLPSSSPAQSKQEQGGLPHLDICKEVHQPALQDLQWANGQRQAEQSSVRLGRQEGRRLYESHSGEASNGSVSSLTVEAQSRVVLSAGEGTTSGRLVNESVPVEPAPAAISTLLSQLQPEVISNLVKIIEGVQKNTVHFYIHSAEEESDVCWEIKEYLKRLGNSECDPQTFIEKKDGQDKLLIIIQNIDIAAHVHKIPALVSLKKLPSVSFAGVDSLDDIKNHTYNELFVSGGFIVSDEFVLNPDFIKQERLETLLQYLEELNTPESPWRWRVHCKTHKKVKEQSRCNSEAQNILNLLTMYHKKQIVEFLSYHECDGQSRQAPDLDCLVKLQAQNIRQRHVIFLTERRFEMFPHYSSSGVVIANIDDILYSMASLIGEACDKLPSSNLHSCPTSPTLRGEEMSLCSDIDTSSARLSNPTDSTSFAPDHESGLVAQPFPYAPDHTVGDKVNEASLPLPTIEAPKDLDFVALRAAVSQFRVARMQASSSRGHLSQESFDVNPHQSFLSHSDMPLLHKVMLKDSITEALTRESTPGLAEISLSPQHATLSQDGAEDKACPGTSSGLQVTICGLNEAPAPALFVSSHVQPTCSQTTDRDPTTEAQVSPKISETEMDGSQEKSALEVATSNLTLPTSSSSTQSKNGLVTAAVTGGKAKHNSNAGLLPVPGTMAYGMNNALVGVDRMLLQSSTLWPQGSVGLNSPGLSSQNGAIGLGSVTSSLGMVSHPGLQGLMPNSNMQMAWNSLAQGTASSVWGVQQGMGLGPVHRTQFIQNYAWHGNPAFQGNRYPPRRGGFGGW